MEQSKERLREAIKFLKKQRIVSGQEQIAHEMGYKRAQTISDMLVGSAEITTKFVAAFSQRYQLSKEWLLTGEGEMLTEGKGAESAAQQTNEPELPYNSGNKKDSENPMENATNEQLAMLQQATTVAVEAIRSVAEKAIDAIGKSNISAENTSKDMALTAKELLHEFKQAVSNGTIAPAAQDKPGDGAASDMIMVPLDAIRNLTKKAGINYMGFLDQCRKASQKT